MKTYPIYFLALLCAGLISYQITAGGAATAGGERRVISPLQAMSARKLAQQYRDGQIEANRFRGMSTVLANAVIRQYRLLTGEDATPIIDVILQNQGKAITDENQEDFRENVKRRSYRFSIQELIDNNRIPAITQEGELSLENQYLGSLDGLKNIPNIVNVQILYLNNNQLIQLQPGTFNGLGRLRRLDLENTQLTQIQPGAFNGLGNLLALDLSNNRLTQLPTGTFKGLKNLERLWLGHNKLTQLQPGVFNGLGNLRTLDLKHNLLAELPPGIFKGLGELRELWVSNNQLTQIQPGTFNGLVKLEALFLDDNPIKHIQPGTFIGLINLRELHLDHDQLTQETKQQIRQELGPRVVVKL